MKIFLRSLLVLGCTFAYAAAAPSSTAEPENQSASSQTAPASRPDSLLVTGEFNRLTPGGGGGGGSIDWVHSTTQGRAFTAGIASFSLDDSRWTFGRVGTAFRSLAQTVAQAQVSLGSGQTRGSGFVYQVFGGEMTRHCFKRVYLRLGDQYLHIGDARGNLLKPGAVFLLVRTLSLDLTYATSTGGNLGTEFLLGRFDFNTRPARFLGGFALGSSTPEVFDLGAGTRAMERDLKQAFVGFVVPLSRSEFSAILDFLNLDSEHRRTLTLSLKVPLGKHRP